MKTNKILEAVKSELDYNNLSEIDCLLIETILLFIFENVGFELGLKIQKKIYVQEKISISIDYSRKLLKWLLEKEMRKDASKWLSSLPENAPKILRTTFSIIMITKNRGDTIRPALKALKKISYPAAHYEIIVVDNGSTDNTSLVVKEELSDAFCSTTYVFEPNGCLCTARNAGIEAARGDWVGFIDDDAICHPDWLLQYLCGLLTYPDAVGMGGPVDLPTNYRKPKWWRSRHSGLLSCKRGASEIRSLKMLENPYGLNMWLNRSNLNEAGNFDERMDIWCPTIADETELFIRIQKRKQIVIFVPGAMVTHYVHTSRLKYLKLIQRAFLVGRSQQTLDWLHSPEVKIGVSLITHLSRALQTHQLGPLWVSVPIEMSLWLGYHYQKRFVLKKEHK